MGNSKYDFLSQRIKDIDSRPGLVVIDCGCGDGSGSSSLLQNLEDPILLAFDSDMHMVNKASEKGINANYGDIKNLSNVDDNTVDVYVCSDTFECMSRIDSLQASNDIKRVVKNGGLIVVSSISEKKVCLSNKKNKQYLSIFDIDNHFFLMNKEYEGQYYNIHEKCNNVLIYRNKK